MYDQYIILLLYRVWCTRQPAREAKRAIHRGTALRGVSKPIHFTFKIRTYHVILYIDVHVFIGPFAWSPQNSRRKKEIK